MLNIPVSKANDSVTLDESKLSDETKHQLMLHGLKQLVNDAHSGEDDPDKALALAAKKAKAIEDNGFVMGAGGGGKSLTPYEKALRDVVEDILRSKGRKAVEAKKDAMDPEKAIRALANDEAKFNENWPKIKAAAERLAKARANKIEVTL